VGDTIGMFGSARILSREQALAHLQKLRKGRQKSAASTPSHRTALRDAKPRSKFRYMRSTRSGAAQPSCPCRSATSPEVRDLLVVRGRNHGSGHLGSARPGGNPWPEHSIADEQRPNAYISPELSFRFHYFFMRKLWFAHLAKALIVVPAEFGNMDEPGDAHTYATGNCSGRQT